MFLNQLGFFQVLLALHWCVEELSVNLQEI